MGYVVCVPAFREHGDGDHAAHILSRFAGFTHRVDDLPELLCRLVPGGIGILALDLLKALAVDPDRPRLPVSFWKSSGKDVLLVP